MIRKIESLALFSILWVVVWIVGSAWYGAFKKERERRAFNKAESLKPFPRLYREKPGQKYTTLPSADVLLGQQMVKEVIDKKKEEE